jgi:hypothetical protein
MAKIIRNSQRGHMNHGWLKTSHSFSFGSFFKPDQVEYRHLRVINEDIIAKGAGFPTHPHSNMEILTYVRKGALAHKDSMGNEEVIPAGELQVMSAGSGIQHSEFNPSSEEVAHIFQIWMYPREENLTPRYDQEKFEDKYGSTVLASSNTIGEGIPVFQDVVLKRIKLKTGDSEDLQPAFPYIYLHVVEGDVTIGENHLITGDAIQLEKDERAPIVSNSKTDTEILVFEMS